MPKTASAALKHWVVIETGGNQRYIFDSNRLRHVVGGSQLVVEACTTQIKKVCRDEEVVQSLSGKAVLLVDSADRGREIVRVISGWALDEAPGLEITGAVGRPFNPDLCWDARSPSTPPPGPVWDPDGVDHVTALHDAFAQQRRARAARPAPQLRFRGLPWHLPCHETGLPAAAMCEYGSGDVQPVSDTARARTGKALDDGRQRLRPLLGPLDLPEITDDLGGDGWIGVVHADGNGVGALMTDFPRLTTRAVASQKDRPVAPLSLTDHRMYLTAVADELDAATREAFTVAVNAVRGEGPLLSPTPILPVLVGGDDVTFVCHAALALPLTRYFLAEFAERTRRLRHLSALVRARDTSADGLTASAGIALVKRHHPLAYAVELAEQLTASAKRATRLPQGTTAAATPPAVSAYDIHVTHEATLRPLTDLRAERVRDGVVGHAGPFVTGDPAALPEHVRHRHEQSFFKVVELLADGSVSAARAHDLREAFDRGMPAYRQRLQVARTKLEARSRDLLEPRTGPSGTDATEMPFLLLPDALLLHGVSTRSSLSPVETRA
jgi:hypothetical protein